MSAVPYPKYTHYQPEGRQPSLLSQDYPRPIFHPSEIYYPPDPLLARCFSSQKQVTTFSAASFAGFLQDTIEVEHCLVIPAIATLRRLPYRLPAKAEQDLYKLATDEGFHAEQSLLFLNELRTHFQLTCPENQRTPLFLKRLERQRSHQENSLYRDLITVLNGVVTETRISIELGRFAAHPDLAPAVKEVCRTHAEDESIHSSQFRALGQWLWAEFDDLTKFAAARFLAESTIARSLIDLERIAFYLHESTARSHEAARRLVYSAYSEDAVIARLLIETKPTISFLSELGTQRYYSFDVALEKERERLRSDLLEVRKSLAV